QRPFVVMEKEASRLIRRLEGFLGGATVDKALAKYEKSLKTSGPILERYYTPYVHPWWDSLKKYRKLVKSGKSVWKYMRDPFERSLIKSAYEIGILQADMPESVRDKFRKDLVDDKNAWAYLFEIQIASHYYQYGYDISWYEDDGQPRPEFKVTADGFEFDVECKRISVDASRKLRRVDFYRLAEMLLPELSARLLCGTIDIELAGRLPPTRTQLENISNQIQLAIPDSGIDSVIHFPFGKVTLSISRNVGQEANWNDLYSSMMARKHHSAHGVVFSTSGAITAKDPIQMLITPKKSEKVLQGIESKIKSAAKQLDGNRPGLICCYLEGLEELSGLEKESNLNKMSSHVLDRDGLSHVIGVSYCVESRPLHSGNVETFSMQGLIFRNPNCKFNVPPEVRFLTDES
ncbi:MAG: hypothetical protein OET90_10600, partial [Desulfuromonadales bacterium]|nr:hypothetical protein [Desulfuromonadales bacterium]